MIFSAYRSDCLRCLQSSAVAFGFEEFFPPGVLEKGEFAPESVETGIFTQFLP